MTDTVETIARALAEAEHGEGAWEHLDDGWHRRYLALAQAVLPFIAAERERLIAIAQACLDQGYPLAVALEMMKGEAPNTPHPATPAPHTAT